MKKLNESVQGDFKDKRYFNSTRAYTLGLLNAFDNVKYWVDDKTNKDTQKEYTTPISFGNYEKSQVLADLTEKEIQKGNINYLPRLVLSFDGMTKNTDRQTQKYQKYTKKNPNGLDVSYNSVSYDFNYRLLVQARGLTITSQIVEEILPHFNPSMSLTVNEYPILEEVNTQILISDPQYDIIEEPGKEEINIITVTFDITVRGNIYSQIGLKGPIDEVKLFTHVWDTASKDDAKIASYYKFDIDSEEHGTHKAKTQHERHFDATGHAVTDSYGEYYDIEAPESHLIKTREDYSKYEIVQDTTSGQPTKDSK